MDVMVLMTWITRLSLLVLTSALYNTVSNVKVELVEEETGRVDCGVHVHKTMCVLTN